jgi:hypothetical protein
VKSEMKHKKERSMNDKLTRRFLENLENIKSQTIATSRMKLEKGNSLIICNMTRFNHEQQARIYAVILLQIRIDSAKVYCMKENRKSGIFMIFMYLSPINFFKERDKT